MTAKKQKTRKSWILPTLRALEIGAGILMLSAGCAVPQKANHHDLEARVAVSSIPENKLNQNSFDEKEIRKHLDRNDNSDYTRQMRALGFQDYNDILDAQKAGVSAEGAKELFSRGFKDYDITAFFEEKVPIQYIIGFLESNYVECQPGKQWKSCPDSSCRIAISNAYKLEFQITKENMDAINNLFRAFGRYNYPTTDSLIKIMQAKCTPQDVKRFIDLGIGRSDYIAYIVSGKKDEPDFDPCGYVEEMQRIGFSPEDIVEAKPCSATLEIAQQLVQYITPAEISRQTHSWALKGIKEKICEIKQVYGFLGADAPAFNDILNFVIRRNGNADVLKEFNRQGRNMTEIAQIIVYGSK